MKKLVLALGLAMVGCGTDNAAGPDVLPNLTLPPKPTNGMQVLTPIVEDIQPGTDNEICTWTDALVTQPIEVRSGLGYQTEPPGHHIVVYYTFDKKPAGTQRPCTDTDMASFRYLVGLGGNGEINEAPGDLIYRVPAGAQIVINHHYLNASDEVMRGQSVINLNYADAGRTYTVSGSTAVLDSSLVVQPGHYEHDIHCVFDRTMKFWMLVPHEHRWGTHINVDLTRAGARDRIFNVDWADQLTFHPPEQRNDPAAPLTVSPGDAMDIHCEWNNDTGHELPFGFEMCVAFGQFVDDQSIGGWACDQGSWSEF